LYGQLSPDVRRLEAREDTAKGVLAGGIIVGLASILYGVAGGGNFAEPSINQPNFAADSPARGACKRGNVSRMATFGFVGIAAMIAGSMVAYSSWPKHKELLDLVNKNNRLSKQPLQLQVGYDPAQRFAFSGAAVSF